MVSRRGFTLIEVLVGLAILVLLVGMIQGIYSTTVRNRETVLARTAEIHAAASILTRISDELGASFVDKERADQTRFEVSTFGGTEASLEFATLMPPIHGLRAGGETRVRYELARDPDAQNPEDRLLKRIEEDDLTSEIGQDSVSYDMLKGVREFTIECFDGKEWTKSWEDSDPKAPTLPKAVRMEVTWADGSLRTSATLYGAKP